MSICQQIFAPDHIFPRMGNLLPDVILCVLTHTKLWILRLFPVSHLIITSRVLKEVRNQNSQKLNVDISHQLLKSAQTKAYNFN